MQPTLPLSNLFFLDLDKFSLYTRDSDNSSEVNNMSIRSNPKEYPSLVDIVITLHPSMMCLLGTAGEVPSKLMLLLGFCSSYKILATSPLSCSCFCSIRWRPHSVCIKYAALPEYDFICRLLGG